MSGEGGPPRPEREDLPGSSPPASREELPGAGATSGWLPPADADPDVDPFGRPWERRESTAPASWPGAAEPPLAPDRPPPSDPPPSYATWPGGSAPAPSPSSLPHTMRLASFGSRAQAAVVDFFVRLALVLAGSLAGALLFVAGEAAGVVGVIAGLVAGFAAAIAYAPVMMARTDGQTVGHKASGTRIVTRDGRRLTGGQATVREVAVKWLLIDVIGGSFVLPTLLNYLWPLWDAENDALHDKLCRTRVVEA